MEFISLLHHFFCTIRCWDWYLNKDSQSQEAWVVLLYTGSPVPPCTASQPPAPSTGGALLGSPHGLGPLHSSSDPRWAGSKRGKQMGEEEIRFPGDKERKQSSQQEQHLSHQGQLHAPHKEPPQQRQAHRATSSLTPSANLSQGSRKQSSL